MLVTFAFTRHPFNRLVSSYNDKIKHHKWNLRQHIIGLGQDIKDLRSNIMREYRKVDPKKNNDYPTPKEFIQYLLNEAKTNGPLTFNRHWRPQYGLCPFCALKFDYIGKVESLDKHVSFLSEHLGFKKLIKPHLKAHSVHDKKKDTKDLKPIEIDQQFYSQLPKKLVRQLYDDIYKAD